MTVQSRALGRQGEALAERHLTRLGAHVLARNYRTRRGEVDLVVEHDGDLVAVEVKTRRPGSLALPEEAVGAAKRARLAGVLASFFGAARHEQQELADRRGRRRAGRRRRRASPRAHP